MTHQQGPAHQSPGNELYPEIPPMKAPSLEFVYRLVAKMHPTEDYEIENIQGTGVSRSIGHIQSGTVRGPEIEGIVMENSGADWAERIHSKKIYYKLDARYTIRTSDGHHVFVQARGLFRPGPGVEYFTHITFEAAGGGPYNWMNGIVAIGALQSFQGAAVIDCWRLTNFLGCAVEDVYTPPPEFTKPPGTVRLIRENGHHEAPELVPQPTPSDDPNDPLNWSRSRKLANFVPTLAITAIIFTQTSLPIVFWVLWIPEFGWTYGQLNAAQAINYVGTALGCILFIPPAVKYGRRSMYILSSAVILATAVWSACMNTLPELYISQLIFGLASATNETIVEMTIADLYFVHQRGTANGIYMVMVMIGSFLSSIIAGYMAADGNWRLCYWVTFAVEAVLLVYFCLFFEESKYIPRIEARTLESPQNISVSSNKKDTSSASENAEQSIAITPQASNTGAHHINSNIPLLSWRQRMRLVTKTDQSLLDIAWTSAVILFRFPVVMYTALQYAFCLCWISAQASLVSIVFTQPPYNFGTVGVGNMSLGVFLGCILGSVYGAISDKTVFWFARRNYGYYEPEMRLQLNHFPALCMGGGFIMFGVTTAKGMHWIYPSIGSAIFGFGLGGLSDVALCVLIDSYQAVTGEAFIGVAFIRNCFSIAISFALVPWMDAQGVQNMCIVMGVWATLMAFMHVPLIIWGKRIREKTAQSYEKMAKERESSHL
ncbi:hypothetical protein FDECE_8639 [Fusarium decemcellulare]|nr:hypothetical protein FDECE_8639 [Fusarium decemcellulare]